MKTKKLFKRMGIGMALAIGFALSLGGTTMAATTPDLGFATTFGVLSSTFTNAGATTINGDFGYVTGTPPTVNGVTYVGVANAGRVAAGTGQAAALANLNSQACTFTFAPGAINLSTDITNPNGIGIYTPGVYCTTGAGAASIGTAGITLSGAGTYIFRINGAFTSVDGSTVTLSNSASACDVFWTPTEATSLGTNNTFIGTVIDDAGITIGDVATWTGRALDYATTVNVSNLNITVPVCTVPIATGGSAAIPRLIPLINVLKVPTPLFLPYASGLVTYNYTVQNIGPNLALANIRTTDDKCSPLVLVSGDVNNDTKLNLGEKWHYTCTAMLSATTTNIVTAYGESDDSYRDVALDTATATVAIGTGIIPLPPPLINIVKIPSRLTPFPSRGGDVKYTYIVTNPGVVAMHDVVTSDNKCSPLVLLSGDANHDHILDLTEKWIYTCDTHISVSTTNTATAKGEANGFTVYDYAFASVLVSDPIHTAAPVAPLLPKTGIMPVETETKNNVWIMFVLAGIFVAGSLIVVLRKNKA